LPFTPFHFGPHAFASLPLRRFIVVPVFLGANLLIDVEPLLVMTFNLDYPGHGYCHTMLFGSLLGLLVATIGYALRHQLARFMAKIYLADTPTFHKMAVSGVLGIWLHVLFDAPLYSDIRPFYPLQVNPLLEVLPPGAVYGICGVCFVPAGLLYVYAVSGAKKART